MTDMKHGINGELGQVAGRSNEGKSIVHTIDPDFILGIARVSAFGAVKYHHRNFLMAPGMKWSSVYESAMRHLLAFWSGEECDEESGLPHLLHASWNLMCLHTYNIHDQYEIGDDRPATIEHFGVHWKEWESKFKLAQLAGAPEKEDVLWKVDMSPPVAAAAIPEMLAPNPNDWDPIKSLMRACTIQEAAVRNRSGEVRLAYKDFENLIFLIQESKAQ